MTPTQTTPFAILLIHITALSVCACGDNTTSGVEIRILDTPAACNPLGGAECMTPWPASIYATDDATSATGRALDIPEGALISNNIEQKVDPALYNGRNGFSPAAPMLIAFDSGMSPDGLVGSDNIPASITDASPTVLLDMQTGERVYHFAELDSAADNWPEKQGLIIRPAARLVENRRYAVALRTSLTAADGSALAIPEGFAAILDDTPTDHALLERVRPRYQAIFDALNAAGVPRDDLLVAWDFTTATDESINRDVLAARNAAIPLMGEAGANLTYEVTGTELHGHPGIRRYKFGTFDAPLLLTNGGAYNASTRLLRNPQTGLPITDGTYRVPFWSMVPDCAYEAEQPVPIMLYGHGLFGSGAHATGGDVAPAITAMCMVVVGTDMRGMSDRDLASIAAQLHDLNNIAVFEQMVQGIINHVALQHIVRGPMAETLLVDEQGKSIVDPTNVVYYGLSQGHIMGSTFVAYDTFIERAVLGAGGANYSLMLERSINWPRYRQLLQGAYQNPLKQLLALHLMQMMWDATEAAGSANVLLTGDIPGTPPKQVLLHMGHADEQVPNLATAWQVRTLGIPLLAPAPYDIFGISTEEGPLSNGLVIWHDGVADPPVGNVPADDTDSHYVMRGHAAVYRQMAEFYATGNIVHTCEGPCMCAEGACE